MEVRKENQCRRKKVRGESGHNKDYLWLIYPFVLTLLGHQIAEGEGHGVAGEDVVTAVDMLAIDREATAGYDGEDSLDNDDGCDVITLILTLI